MKNFLEANEINIEELEKILEQCFLGSLFEELIEYIEKNQLYIPFKVRLQTSYNKKEELYILKELIGEFSNVILLDYQLSTILRYLKAYYNKSKTRSPLPMVDKLTILNRQNNQCMFCMTNIDIKSAHFDHVIAFKWVGDEIETNYQALCPTCNLEKSTDSYYYLKSILIKPKRSIIKTTSKV